MKRSPKKSDARIPIVIGTESPADSLESNPDSYRDESSKSEENNSTHGNNRDGTPQSETEPSTANSQLPTEPMEVHHHPRLDHNPKPWKEYILEGLMIFLAVTMGFFAESLRERISDNSREQKFAQTLYTELLADSVAAGQIITTDLNKEKDLDYLYAYFKDSSLTVLPRQFYPAYTIGLYMVNSNTFEPKDGILSQLENAGGLQYFKSVMLRKLLGELTVAINNIRNRNDQVYQFFSSPIKPFMLAHYDFNWLDQVRDSLPISKRNLNDLINAYAESKLFIKADILNVSAINRSEAANLMKFNKQMQSSTRLLQLKNYVIINHNILQALRSAYNLQNE